MKYLFWLIFFCYSSTSIKSQSKTEDDWFKKYSGEVDWEAKNYIGLIDFIGWKPVKAMKQYDVKDVKATFLLLSAPQIRQMNMDGTYYCSYKHEEMYQLWNLYYPKISQEYWDKYCKGFIALLSFDGFPIK